MTVPELMPNAGSTQTTPGSDKVSVGRSWPCAQALEARNRKKGKGRYFMPPPLEHII
jgi:hypothetical protein